MDSTRDRLVHTALRLFHAKGYAATSVADILREAGPTPVRYHDFPTEQELLLAVLGINRDGHRADAARAGLARRRGSG